MIQMKKETISKILRKYIEDYEVIINNPNESRIRRSVAESAKNLVENIMEDLLNVEDD